MDEQCTERKDFSNGAPFFYITLLLNMRLCGGFHALSVGSMSVSVAKGRLMYPLFTRCWQIGWVGLKATRCDPANRHCGDATERILVGLA